MASVNLRWLQCTSLWTKYRWSCLPLNKFHKKKCMMTVCCRHYVIYICFITSIIFLLLFHLDWIYFRYATHINWKLIQQEMESRTCNSSICFTSSFEYSVYSMHLKALMLLWGTMTFYKKKKHSSYHFSENMEKEAQFASQTVLMKTRVNTLHLKWRRWKCKSYSDIRYHQFRQISFCSKSG